MPPVAAEAPVIPGGQPESTSLIDEVLTSVSRTRHSDGAIHPSLMSPAVPAQFGLLQAEVVKLKDSHARLSSELAHTQEALTATKAELFAERRRHTLAQRELQAHKDEVFRLQERFDQLEMFTARLVNENPKYSTLSVARDMVLEGEDADVALVSAIKDAASNPTSAWRRILDAVTGPRTQEEYLSAINLCLLTRKALRDSKKITKFWKGVALEDGNHAETITPSPSNISSIHEVLSEERQNAIKLLLERRRSGEAPLRRPTLPNRHPHDSLGDVKLKTLSRLVEPSSSSRSIPSASSFPSDTSSKSDLALAPLASQVFKQQLMASHSSRKLLKSISRSSGSISVTVSTSSVSGMGYESSSESLKEWTLVDSIMGSEDELDLFSDILTAQLMAADTRVTSDLREEKVSRVRLSGGPQPFDNSAFAKLIGSVSTQPSMTKQAAEDALNAVSNAAQLPAGNRINDEIDEGALAVARALSSFERICSIIRSGNELGSLETISERTEPDSGSERGLSRRPSTYDDRPTVTRLPTLKPILKNAKPPCPLPLPPSHAVINDASRVGQSSDVKTPRKSLIPRTSKPNLTVKTPQSKPKQPLTPKRSQPSLPNKMSQQSSGAPKPLSSNSVTTRGKKSGPGKDSNKENIGSDNVLAKGKKVIRGIHRAVS